MRNHCVVVCYLVLFALTELLSAQPMHYQPLPSTSRPFYTSYGSGSYVVFQQDGTVSFLNSGLDFLFYAIIPPSLSGSAYHVLDADEDYGELLVTNGTSLYIVQCTANKKACVKPSNSRTVRLPLSSPNKPIKKIRPVNYEMYPDQLLMASVDTLITFDASSMQIISSFTWKPQVNLSVDDVSGLGMTDGEYGAVVSAVDSQQITRPGYVVTFTMSLDRRIRNPVLTYMDMSPLNFVVSIDQHNIMYWTQVNTTNGRAYLNSAGGYSSSPATPTLPSGSIVSPSFMGQYTPIQSGVVAIGKYNSPTGFSLQCLHLAYGFSSPEIRKTNLISVPASSGLGLPFLGIQTHPLIAGLLAVSPTKKGYAAVDISFSSCSSSMAADQNKLDPNKLGQNNLDQNTLRPSSILHSEKSSRSILNIRPSSIQSLTSRSNFWKPNCVRSDCDVRNPNSCPPQHCWGQGSTGLYLCCNHAPVF